MLLNVYGLGAAFDLVTRTFSCNFDPDVTPSEGDTKFNSVLKRKESFASNPGVTVGHTTSERSPCRDSWKRQSPNRGRWPRADADGAVKDPKGP